MRAQSSVGAKEINIVPGSKAELYVQTIESDDVSVFVDGTENLTVESVENVGGGRYKAVVAASGDYSGGEYGVEKLGDAKTVTLSIRQ